MKINDLFNKGDILVAVQEDRMSCNKIRVHKGAIVMAASDFIDIWKEVEIYKSFDRFKNNKKTRVSIYVLRLANKTEKEAFYKGTRNITEIR